MSSWKEVNQNLIAKALGEMIFEENISVSHEGELYSFTASEEVTYTFEGKPSLWGWIKVLPHTIRRNGESNVSASQFFIDTQMYTKMSDITLAQFIEEMRSTLFADLHLNHEVSADEFIHLNFIESQQLLNGHPKILLNKGRLGWSTEDWKSYAPENSPVFPLKLIAIKKDLIKGILPGQDEYLSLVTNEKLEEIKKSLDLSQYVLMPVHPWQWVNVIFYQYQNEIQEQEIIDLGLTSFHYTPQTSLRTFNCIERPDAHEIKLPLSILNTSCIRGLPAKTIELGVKISTTLKKLIDSDDFLKNKVEILAEVAGINYVAKDLGQIKEAPYRFHEFLGVIWRESTFSKISADQNENIILTANLLYQDKRKQSAMASYIKASGISADEWIREYAKKVVIPLYHLQSQHGIGLVSHGQNIILVLKNNKPHKLVLKDFQGDFRLSSKLNPHTKEIFYEVYQDIVQLPSEHLIHDLYTAHFVTLLRYVGMNLELEGVLNEKNFYQLIAEEIKAYEQKFPCEISLLKPQFEKILVNSVRFKIGYGDSTQRPLPLLGTLISNPLYQAYYESL